MDTCYWTIRGDERGQVVLNQEVVMHYIVRLRKRDRILRCYSQENIPGGPLQDFEMEAWVTLKSKNISEMGRVEVLLLDETSNVISRINMNDLYATAEITRAHMTVEIAEHPIVFRKLVDTSGFYSTTFNQFRGAFTYC